MSSLTSVPAFRSDGADCTVDRWFAAQGAPLRLDLARSGAAGLTVAELLAITGSSTRDLLDVQLDYGAGSGSARLARAIRRSSGVADDASVVVTCGAVEALLLLSIATAGRGQVVVGTPAYGALLGVPAAAGASVLPVSVWNPIDGLYLDHLAAAVTHDTAMVVVNSPHNPSGACASLAALDELAEVCAARGAILVVDEVARGTLDPHAVSAVHSRGFAQRTTVVLGDASKAMGLGGLRIGWLVTADAQLAARVAASKDVTTVASGTLSDHLATAALENQAAILERVTAWARLNLGALSHLLGALGVADGWSPPRDGLVAFPALSSRGGVDALVAALRRRDVGIVPGWLFGEPDRVRIGLGIAPDLFTEALGNLDQVARA